MKKLIWSFMLFLAITTFSSSKLQADEKNKALLGEWIYEVSDAPYGYEKGSLIFSEKEGQTICVIKLEAGELAVSDLVVEDNNVSFVTSVDGNPIHVKLKQEDNKLSGTVDSPEGPKTLTALKK